LAEGDARAGLAAFRRAWAGWGELNAPYDAARSHVLIGLACRALGDEDSAQMELDAARPVFLQLDAAPDLVRVEELSRISRPVVICWRNRYDASGIGRLSVRARSGRPGTLEGDLCLYRMGGSLLEACR
jgi:hypothetical protein